MAICSRCSRHHGCDWSHAEYGVCPECYEAETGDRMAELRAKHQAAVDAPAKTPEAKAVRAAREAAARKWEGGESRFLVRLGRADVSRDCPRHPVSGNPYHDSVSGVITDLGTPPGVTCASYFVRFDRPIRDPEAAIEDVHIA